MAGSYPNAPAPRIAYHLDSDILVKYSHQNTITSLSQGQKTWLNDETMRSNAFSFGSNTYDSYMSFYFPASMDVSGYFMSRAITTNITLPDIAISTSTDTTNGDNGTWTSQGIATSYQSTAIYYREVSTTSFTSIRGLRFTCAVGLYKGHNVANIHLYGSPSVAPTSGLAIWDPSSDVRLSGSGLDFGAIQRTTTSSAKTFRIKNLSTTQAANTVIVSLSGATAGLYSLSADGSTYGSTVTITTIAANTISSVLYIRRTSTSADTLAATSVLLTAQAGSWV